MFGMFKESYRSLCGWSRGKMIRRVVGNKVRVVMRKLDNLGFVIVRFFLVF